ncbi:OmpA family protein [Actinomadura rubrisoli]|uniref:OmpA family protein n=1 Tax=Actinomadura rubrisoli TaxID=2530368 RepID=A0A4R5AI74_9ACTN|nr:OmpA family protein [Actinomadura rubrisoli]TDD69812.1 OmpA family protein [Actinomadura rubrisoli]
MPAGRSLRVHGCHRVYGAVPVAVSLAALLLAAGCADSSRAEKSDPPTVKGNGPSPSPTVQAASVLSKEGWFGTSNALHARVQIKGVERQAGKSVLRYTVISMDTAPKTVPFTVRLLDPVARKLYRQTSSGGQAGEQFQPNAAREMATEFPLVPQDVTKLTVLTTGTAGEFTGVPVTGTGGAPGSSPGTPSSSPSAPGSPSGTPGVNGAVPPINGTNPADLYDITEGEVKDVTSGGSDVTVNLRTDVLFAVDSAKLSSRAKSVLDQAAQEIKQNTDPAKRALTFNGHTDSKGSDTDNLKLSKDRAEAVMKEMKTRLGGSYTYSAQGKGEAEPIAKEGGPDDAKARARNRRVQISYQVKQQTPGGTGTTTPPAGGRGSTIAPAAFRPQDGAKVASRYGRFGKDKRRLDVKPFYRDGAYIVAVFDIVNEGPGATPPTADYAHKDYPGGVFTSFSVLVPGGKDVYRAVRISTLDAQGVAPYVDPGFATFRTAVNEPVRGFAYIPAPPGNPSTVVFDGGPFGKVNNVPVS